MIGVSPELLRKYGTQGPRYTSYPTAPHFQPVDDRGALEQAWRASTSDLSLYMHVPFCQVRCTFCGCHVQITKHRDRSADYVDHLLAEIEIAGGLVDLARPLRQVHLGGGTPNFLLPEAMTRLVGSLRSRLAPQDDTEWAIECDPRHLDAAYVDLLLDLGMNRFSLGVQDLEPEVMAAVNRPQTLLELEDVVTRLRSRGDVSLNFDLIYGLPKQTPVSWSRTLSEVVRLRPSRLAIFGYAHVPWLKKHQLSLERQGLPDAELRSELMALARAAMRDAGYVEIGMDHFALPTDELALARETGTLHRNFMGYTTKRGLDQVAVGVSAISRVGRCYTQDLKDQPAWEADIAAGRLPWERGLVMTDDDLLRGDVITELSCNGRLDVRAIEVRHGVDFAATFAPELESLREMERDGLLAITPDAITLTETGAYLVRNACMVFDAWLPKDAAGAAGPRYSSTV
jgi:oxygen-independent coproporphyrinogen-3 oxidase